MAVLPAVDYISDNVRTQGEVKTALEDMRDKTDQAFGEEPLEISGGVVTPLGRSRYLAITTEASASADQLDRIVPTNFEVGDLISCFQPSAALDVTYAHDAGTGDGKLILGAQIDYTPGNELLVLTLQLQSNLTWLERRFR